MVNKVDKNQLIRNGLSANQLTTLADFQRMFNKNQIALAEGTTFFSNQDRIKIDQEYERITGYDDLNKTTTEKLNVIIAAYSRYRSDVVKGVSQKYDQAQAEGTSFLTDEAKQAIAKLYKATFGTDKVGVSVISKRVLIAILGKDKAAQVLNDLFIQAGPKDDFFVFKPNAEEAILKLSIDGYQKQKLLNALKQSESGRKLNLLRLVLDAQEIKSVEVDVLKPAEKLDYQEFAKAVKDLEQSLENYLDKDTTFGQSKIDNLLKAIKNLSAYLGEQDPLTAGLNVLKSFLTGKEVYTEWVQLLQDEKTANRVPNTAQDYVRRLAGRLGIYNQCALELADVYLKEQNWKYDIQTHIELFLEDNKGKLDGDQTQHSIAQIKEYLRNKSRLDNLAKKINYAEEDRSYIDGLVQQLGIEKFLGEVGKYKEKIEALQKKMDKGFQETLKILASQGSKEFQKIIGFMQTDTVKVNDLLLEGLSYLVLGVLGEAAVEGKAQNEINERQKIMASIKYYAALAMEDPKQVAEDLKDAKLENLPNVLNNYKFYGTYAEGNQLIKKHGFQTWAKVSLLFINDHNKVPEEIKKWCTSVDKGTLLWNSYLTEVGKERLDKAIDLLSRAHPSEGGPAYLPSSQVKLMKEALRACAIAYANKDIDSLMAAMSKLDPLQNALKALIRDDRLAPDALQVSKDGGLYLKTSDGGKVALDTYLQYKVKPLSKNQVPTAANIKVNSNLSLLKIYLAKELGCPFETRLELDVLTKKDILNIINIYNAAPVIHYNLSSAERALLGSIEGLNSTQADLINRIKSYEYQLGFVGQSPFTQEDIQVLRTILSNTQKGTKAYALLATLVLGFYSDTDGLNTSQVNKLKALLNKMPDGLVIDSEDKYLKLPEEIRAFLSSCIINIQNIIGFQPKIPVIDDLFEPLNKVLPLEQLNKSVGSVLMQPWKLSALKIAYLNELKIDINKLPPRKQKMFVEFINSGQVPTHFLGWLCKKLGVKNKNNVAEIGHLLVRSPVQTKEATELKEKLAERINAIAPSVLLNCYAGEIPGSFPSGLHNATKTLIASTENIGAMWRMKVTQEGYYRLNIGSDKIAQLLTDGKGNEITVQLLEQIYRYTQSVLKEYGKYAGQLKQGAKGYDDALDIFRKIEDMFFEGTVDVDNGFLNTVASIFGGKAGLAMDLVTLFKYLEDLRGVGSAASGKITLESEGNANTIKDQPETSSGLYIPFTDWNIDLPELSEDSPLRYLTEPLGASAGFMFKFGYMNPISLTLLPINEVINITKNLASDPGYKFWGDAIPDLAKDTGRFIGGVIIFRSFRPAWYITGYRQAIKLLQEAFKDPDDIDWPKAISALFLFWTTNFTGSLFFRGRPIDKALVHEAQLWGAKRALGAAEFGLRGVDWLIDKAFKHNPNLAGQLRILRKKFLQEYTPIQERLRRYGSLEGCSKFSNAMHTVASYLGGTKRIKWLHDTWSAIKFGLNPFYEVPMKFAQNQNSPAGRYSQRILDVVQKYGFAGWRVYGKLGVTAKLLQDAPPELKEKFLSIKDGKEITGFGDKTKADYFYAGPMKNHKPISSGEGILRIQIKDGKYYLQGDIALWDLNKVQAFVAKQKEAGRKTQDIVLINRTSGKNTFYPAKHTSESSKYNFIIYGDIDTATGLQKATFETKAPDSVEPPDIKGMRITDKAQIFREQVKYLRWEYQQVDANGVEKYSKEQLIEMLGGLKKQMKNNYSEAVLAKTTACLQALDAKLATGSEAKKKKGRQLFDNQAEAIYCLMNDRIAVNVKVAQGKTLIFGYANLLRSFRGELTVFCIGGGGDEQIDKAYNQIKHLTDYLNKFGIYNVVKIKAGDGETVRRAAWANADAIITTIDTPNFDYLRGYLSPGRSITLIADEIDEGFFKRAVNKFIISENTGADTKSQAYEYVKFILGDAMTLGIRKQAKESSKGQGILFTEAGSFFGWAKSMIGKGDNGLFTINQLEKFLGDLEALSKNGSSSDLYEMRWRMEVDRIFADKELSNRLIEQCNKWNVKLNKDGLEPIQARDLVNNVLTSFIDMQKVMGVVSKSDFYLSKQGILLLNELGRVQPGSKKSEGMHQLLEAMSGYRLTKPNASENSIAISSLIRKKMFNGVIGGSGTAGPVEKYLNSLGIAVVELPNRIKQSEITFEQAKNLQAYLDGKKSPAAEQGKKVYNDLLRTAEKQLQRDLTEYKKMSKDKEFIESFKGQADYEEMKAEYLKYLENKYNLSGPDDGVLSQLRIKDIDKNNFDLGYCDALQKALNEKIAEELKKKNPEIAEKIGDRCFSLYGQVKFQEVNFSADKPLEFYKRMATDFLNMAKTRKAAGLDVNKSIFNMESPKEAEVLFTEMRQAINEELKDPENKRNPEYIKWLKEVKAELGAKSKVLFTVEGDEKVQLAKFLKKFSDNDSRKIAIAYGIGRGQDIEAKINFISLLPSTKVDLDQFLGRPARGPYDGFALVYIKKTDGGEEKQLSYDEVMASSHGKKMKENMKDEEKRVMGSNVEGDWSERVHEFVEIDTTANGWMESVKVRLQNYLTMLIETAPGETKAERLIEAKRRIAEIFSTKWGTVVNIVGLDKIASIEELKQTVLAGIERNFQMRGTWGVVGYKGDDLKECVTRANKVGNDFVTKFMKSHNALSADARNAAILMGNDAWVRGILKDMTEKVMLVPIVANKEKDKSIVISDVINTRFLNDPFITDEAGKRKEIDINEDQSKRTRQKIENHIVKNGGEEHMGVLVLDKKGRVLDAEIIQAKNTLEFHKNAELSLKQLNRLASAYNFVLDGISNGVKDVKGIKTVEDVYKYIVEHRINDVKEMPYLTPAQKSLDCKKIYSITAAQFKATMKRYTTSFYVYLNNKYEAGKYFFVQWHSHNKPLGNDSLKLDKQAYGGVVVAPAKEGGFEHKVYAGQGLGSARFNADDLDPDRLDNLKVKENKDPNAPKQYEYKVKSGDTVYGIVDKYLKENPDIRQGKSPEDMKFIRKSIADSIHKINGLDSIHLITIGQKLTLPDSIYFKSSYEPLLVRNAQDIKDVVSKNLEVMIRDNEIKLTESVKNQIIDSFVKTVCLQNGMEIDTQLGRQIEVKIPTAHGLVAIFQLADTELAKLQKSRNTDAKRAELKKLLNGVEHWQTECNSRRGYYEANKVNPLDSMGGFYLGFVMSLVDQGIRTFTSGQNFFDIPEALKGGVKTAYYSLRDEMGMYLWDILWKNKYRSLYAKAPNLEHFGSRYFNKGVGGAAVPLFVLGLIDGVESAINEFGELATSDDPYMRAAYVKILWTLMIKEAVCNLTYEGAQLITGNITKLPKWAIKTLSSVIGVAFVRGSSHLASKVTDPMIQNYIRKARRQSMYMQFIKAKLGTDNKAAIEAYIAKLEGNQTEFTAFLKFITDNTGKVFHKPDAEYENFKGLKLEHQEWITQEVVEERIQSIKTWKSGFKIAFAGIEKACIYKFGYKNALKLAQAIMVKCGWKVAATKLGAVNPIVAAILIIDLAGDIGKIIDDATDPLNIDIQRFIEMGKFFTQNDSRFLDSSFIRGPRDFQIQLARYFKDLGYFDQYKSTWYKAGLDTRDWDDMMDALDKLDRAHFEGWFLRRFFNKTSGKLATMMVGDSNQIASDWPNIGICGPSKELLIFDTLMRVAYSQFVKDLVVEGVDVPEMYYDNISDLRFEPSLVIKDRNVSMGSMMFLSCDQIKLKKDLEGNYLFDNKHLDLSYFGGSVNESDRTKKLRAAYIQYLIQEEKLSQKEAEKQAKITIIENKAFTYFNGLEGHMYAKTQLKHEALITIGQFYAGIGGGCAAIKMAHARDEKQKAEDNQEAFKKIINSMSQVIGFNMHLRSNGQKCVGDITTKFITYYAEYLLKEKNTVQNIMDGQKKYNEMAKGNSLIPEIKEMTAKEIAIMIALQACELRADGNSIRCDLSLIPDEHFAALKSYIQQKAEKGDAAEICKPVTQPNIMTGADFKITGRLASYLTGKAMLKKIQDQSKSVTLPRALTIDQFQIYIYTMYAGNKLSDVEFKNVMQQVMSLNMVELSQHAVIPKGTEIYLPRFVNNKEIMPKAEQASFTINDNEIIDLKDEGRLDEFMSRLFTAMEKAGGDVPYNEVIKGLFYREENGTGYICYDVEWTTNNLRLIAIDDAMLADYGLTNVPPAEKKIIQKYLGLQLIIALKQHKKYDVGNELEKLVKIGEKLADYREKAEEIRSGKKIYRAGMNSFSFKDKTVMGKLQEAGLIKVIHTSDYAYASMGMGAAYSYSPDYCNWQPQALTMSNDEFLKLLDELKLSDDEIEKIYTARMKVIQRQWVALHIEELEKKLDIIDSRLK
ncbi:LysM peptidoglycan-binding domain-containing protein [Candidatus Margulisiibacteriota bacterium]